MEKDREIAAKDSVQENMPRSVTVLLAEDNPVNALLGRKILTKEGYEVRTAKNGKEAIDKFFSDPESIDLIFMDVQLPEIDGIAATREIREKGFDQVPIVAMTAHAMKKDRGKCLDAGMNDYIAKPIERESLLEMVSKWVLER